MSQVENRAIIEAEVFERLDIDVAHGVQVLGRTNGEIHQGGFPAGQFGRTWISRDRIDDVFSFGLELRPEIFCVGANSVMTAIRPRNGHGNQFAVCAGQRRWAEHHRAVELNPRPQDVGVEAGNLEYMVDPSGTLACRFVQARQQTRGIFGFNRIDVCAFHAAARRASSSRAKAR